MTAKDHLQDIRLIVRHTGITDDHSYRIGTRNFTVAYQQTYQRWHQPLNSFGQNSGDENQLRANLQSQLAGTLYASFYCLGKVDWQHHDTDGPAAATPPAASNRNDTIRSLSEANSTQNRLDPYWTVYAVDSYGSAFVHKNGQLRYLTPNEWEFAGKSDTSLQVGTVVNLKIVKEDTAVQPVFYHVRSTELMPQDAEFVRIYFNTNFDGARLLVREITGSFNRYQVPFLFKCLNQPELFNRADNTVLYLDRADFSFGGRLLRPILKKLGQYSRPETPLFTHPIVPGVSFSEDPGDGQSFGMSRCTLVAQGLVSAFHKGLTSQEKKLAEILALFKKNGVDPARIYLKPNSKFPYDFSVLTD